MWEKNRTYSKKFFKDPTPTDAVCILCSKKVNRCNNTSRLIDHLKKYHHENEQFKNSQINLSIQTPLNIKDSQITIQISLLIRSNHDFYQKRVANITVVLRYWIPE